MAYLTRELIANAYYASQIVALDLETVSASQESRGLKMLNALLAFKSADNVHIPYFTQYDFTAVVNKETYFIPNLIEADSVVFFIGDIRYPMQELTRKQYFSTGRVNNVASLPFSYRLERRLNGSNLYLYFLPSQEYPMTIWGKFGLGAVTLDQDLSLTLDAFYIEYLRLALAQYLCAQFGIKFQEENSNILATYEKKITELSPPDFMLTKVSSFTAWPQINWGDITWGRGWRPA